jgi:hypothetical protein
LVPQKSSKETFCGALIPSRLHQNVNHLAILIHSSPKILLLAVDTNEDFVQMPANHPGGLDVALACAYILHRTSDTRSGSSHTRR